MKAAEVSVIIPVYNVGKYLQQAIDSVVDQTLGFKDHIEIILVDDGSSDNSAEICRENVKKFPNNIRYVYQKNRGVSEARNNGLSQAGGRYVHFLDGDDMLSKNFYELSVNFLERHSDIDFVASKIKFFDKIIDAHPLNFKFNKDRIIDIIKNPEDIILHLTSCVFRRAALNNLRFDSDLRFTEDAKLLNEVLVKKKRYGIVAKSQYNYRKRSNGNSAIDSGQTDKGFYLVTPKLVYESLAKTWTTDKKLHPYMQHLLLYDLSYRIAGAPYKLLSASEERAYAAVILNLLKQIDDGLVEQSRWYTSSQKRYLISVKHEQRFSKFGFVDNAVPETSTKHPVLNILFNWRFTRAIEQFRRLRGYNLTQLSLKAKLFEYAKPWLVMLEAIADIPRALILRTAYFFAKQFKKRDLWLISDRPLAAGDNGEALFRYIVAQRPDADVYFVLSKKSADFARLKSIGRTISHGGWWYLLKFLLADKITSSHADIETTNPFIRNIDHYKDMIHHQFVFLQHGVISNDLSGWLNKKNQKIDLFITSSQLEHDSIVDNPAYGYTEKEVKITGLARWDLLNNNPKNKLIIAPTFRAGLLRNPMKKDGTRDYDSGFKNSDYFKFYDELIHDKQVNKILKQKNVAGEFYIHPNFSQQIGDFTPSENIKIAQFPYNYENAITEGSLLVTDYSSIAYDFAYLGKPVIYAQFDEDEFYKSHSYTKGYFYDYEKDGFGPVTHHYEDTISAIIYLIEKDCVMDNEYRGRADNFFMYHDTNNRKRIYESILFSSHG